MIIMSLIQRKIKIEEPCRDKPEPTLGSIYRSQLLFQQTCMHNFFPNSDFVKYRQIRKIFH